MGQARAGRRMGTGWLHGAAENRLDGERNAPTSPLEQMSVVLFHLVATPPFWKANLCSILQEHPFSTLSPHGAHGTHPWKICIF